MATAKQGIKKKFFEVKVPMTSSKVFLYSTSEESLENSVIRLDLTKSLRGKSIEMKARVVRSAEGLVGEPSSLELMGSYVRRMMRKGSDYIEDSFEASCKDSVLRIKPFMLTRNKVSRAIRRELRDAARKHIESYIKVRTSNEIFSEITTNKIQKELFLKLKKIYPLSLCEIRIAEIVSKSVKAEEPAEEAKPKTRKKTAEQ